MDVGVLVAVVCVTVGVLFVGRDVTTLVTGVPLCVVGACLCALWCLCACLVPVSVDVCVCLWACLLGTGMGVGVLDGEGADTEGVPAVWGVRNAAVSEEASA